MTQIVKMQYFKPSGKYVGEGELKVDPTKEMFEIFEIARNLQEKRRLPGLRSGHDIYYVLVNAPGHRNDYPHLVVPLEWPI